ncbi:MAG: bifunctional metallophosphatase/5'-nucleotidase [Bacteroidetes bacterium]|nr:MAG: bifunctional metallophosphatase/5'-nucleotidase [Bacteroidota bacterium]
MPLSRRTFLRRGALAATGSLFLPGLARADDERHLVILHTNDTHSRIDPFPMDGGRNQGLGGAARRATLVQQIRAHHPNVLLLDSGDIFQGTPYFNLFKGEVEFRTMTAMGYDVATLGNHDFDNGVEGLAAMLPHAGFDIVSANYDVSASPLQARVQPWTIREVGGVRVGIFGLGIRFERLVLAELHEGVVYHDPVAVARDTVQTLQRQGCHLIVCLSHLGYRYRDDRVSDVEIARLVPGIHLILGGHTHTFMDAPDVFRHPHDPATVVHQVGFAGIRLGRVDVFVGPDGTVRRWLAHSLPVDARWDVA